jgi:hypothetical protein
MTLLLDDRITKIGASVKNDLIRIAKLWSLVALEGCTGLRGEIAYESNGSFWCTIGLQPRGARRSDICLSEEYPREPVEHAAVKVGRRERLLPKAAKATAKCWRWLRGHERHRMTRNSKA